VRSAGGGAGKIESFPNGSADPTGLVTVPFEVEAGDWQELEIELKNQAALGTVRVYLPDADIDFIEVAPVQGRALRSDFGRNP
jgi:hypothetical protein